MDNSNITVALILGGTSPEREVSKATGKSILSALRSLNYKVKVIDPAYGLMQPQRRKIISPKAMQFQWPTKIILK